MKKLLLSTLAVLALSASVQTVSIASPGSTAKFVIGEGLVVVACTAADAITLQNTAGEVVCVAVGTVAHVATS